MNIRFRYTKFPPEVYFPVVDLIVTNPNTKLHLNIATLTAEVIDS